MALEERFAAVTAQSKMKPLGKPMSCILHHLCGPMSAWPQSGQSHPALARTRQDLHLGRPNLADVGQIGATEGG